MELKLSLVEEGNLLNDQQFQQDKLPRGKLLLYTSE